MGQLIHETGFVQTGVVGTVDEKPYSGRILNLYNKEFAFLMPDHHERYRTHFGSCLSIVTLITVIFYGGWKLLDMLSYNILSQSISCKNI